MRFWTACLFSPYLCDTGSEISIINSALLTDIDYQVVGNVQLKPFCGKAISADVICVNVAKGDDDDDDDDGIFIYCAVVSELHDQMILAD